ncbi:hypothetical protein PZS74_23575 [Citrobacter freundii]|uniref:hypothetical protein n=1 Tax=Citrobacter freundii TaxID=546 RepID=UPI002B3E3F6B|nr:hypothetical protein [Citrobacter freundii]
MPFDVCAPAVLNTLALLIDAALDDVAIAVTLVADVAINEYDGAVVNAVGNVIVTPPLDCPTIYPVWIMNPFGCLTHVPFPFVPVVHDAMLGI